MRELSKSPTPCKQLMNVRPWYVGIVDSSSHSVGGVIVGEEKEWEYIPTLF
jgi:hypothetical protein